MNFSFINRLCAPLYCADNGRLAIEPEVLFRMLLVGYLYGIESEKRLEEDINWRKTTIELSFAEAKVNHGLRYAHMLGIKNMREQSFLTAAEQNIKRLVAACLGFLFVNGLKLRPCWTF